MKPIEEDLEYMEGIWAGKVLVQHLDSSTYGTLDVAIGVKKTVVEKFEKEFGYSRNMPEYNRDYAFNLGMLDALKEYKKNQED
tara:strand:- start:355 stop:603 length:249 start_codon:yes stop_codon:yes gene_type:complete